MRRLFLILLALVLAAPALVADDVHIFVGTIAKLDEEKTRMVVTWDDEGERRAEELAIGPATSITRDGIGVARSELKEGVAVTVLAMENPYLILDVLEATDILLGRQDVRTIFE